MDPSLIVLAVKENISFLAVYVGHDCSIRVVAKTFSG
jgi:hypothetical protein